jgi:NADH-quinone oxidoreductase subunit J
MIAFYLLASVAVLSSLLVIAQRNPIHSVLLLIASFGALAGLYIELDAPFAAVIQIIVYAGAIMVLFLFVVMLLNAPREDTDLDLRSGLITGPLWLGALLAGVLGLQLAWALADVADAPPFPDRAVSSVSELGRVLFTEYAFPFEVTSVLILVAMVGAVVLARRDRPRERS